MLIWSSHQLTPRTFKLVVLEYGINMIILLVIVYFFLEVKIVDREGWACPNITLVSGQHSFKNSLKCFGIMAKPFWLSLMVYRMELGRAVLF